MANEYFYTITTVGTWDEIGTSNTPRKLPLEQRHNEKLNNYLTYGEAESTETLLIRAKQRGQVDEFGIAILIPDGKNRKIRHMNTPQFEAKSNTQVYFVTILCCEDEILNEE